MDHSLAFTSISVLARKALFGQYQTQKGYRYEWLRVSFSIGNKKLENTQIQKRFHLKSSERSFGVSIENENLGGCQILN